MTKEQTIRKLMKNLALSYVEAEQLYNDDLNDVSVDLTDEQKAVVREMTTADRKVETAPRKRERKADENKRFLINVIAALFEENKVVSDIEIVNPEREITFSFMGETYKIILSRPRKTS